MSTCIHVYFIQISGGEILRLKGLLFFNLRGEKTKRAGCGNDETEKVKEHTKALCTKIQERRAAAGRKVKISSPSVWVGEITADERKLGTFSPTGAGYTLHPLKNSRIWSEWHLCERVTMYCKINSWQCFCHVKQHGSLATLMQIP